MTERSAVWPGRSSVVFMLALAAGAALGACSASLVPAEAEERPAARGATSVAEEALPAAAAEDAAERAAAGVEGEEAPEDPLEFTLKLVIDAPAGATSGRQHRIRASCHDRDGARGLFASLGSSRHDDPPWEFEWKMSGAPGRYALEVSVDDLPERKAEFELLPSGTAYPQVLEVTVGPPEW